MLESKSSDDWLLSCFVDVSRPLEYENGHETTLLIYVLDEKLEFFEILKNCDISMGYSGITVRVIEETIHERFLRPEIYKKIHLVKFRKCQNLDEI